VSLYDWTFYTWAASLDVCCNCIELPCGTLHFFEPDFQRPHTLNRYAGIKIQLPAAVRSCCPESQPGKVVCFTCRCRHGGARRESGTENS
jgi:hypothetical protein